jgi:hypothetical protein
MKALSLAIMSLVSLPILIACEVVDILALPSRAIDKTGLRGSARKHAAAMILQALRGLSETVMTGT